MKDTIVPQDSGQRPDEVCISKNWLERQENLERILLESTLRLLDEPQRSVYLSALLEQIAQTFDTPDVFLWCRNGNVLESEAALGVHRFYRNKLLQPGEDVAGQVWQSAQSLCIANYDTWPQRVSSLPYGLLGTVLGIPLWLEGEVVGVLGLSYPEPERPTEGEQQGLERFAQVVAFALRHYELSADRDNQKEFSETLVSGLSETIVQTDADLYVRYVNPAWERLVGVSAELSLGCCFLSFVHPDDRKALHETIKTYNLNRVDRFVLEYRLRRHHQDRWITSRVQVTRDASGQIVACSSILSDITDRKLGEDALRLSEQQKKQLLNSLAEAVVETDTRGFLTYINPAWMQMTGFAESESLGKHYLEFVFPEDRAAVRRVIRRAHLDEPDNSRGEHRLLTCRGEPLWVSSKGSWLRDTNGEVVGLTAVLTDIHERKRAEQAILESRERYRSLVDSINGVIWEADGSGKSTFVSPRTRELFGYDYKEWLNTPGIWERHLYPADAERVIALQKDSLASGQDYQVEYRFINRQGEVLWLRDVCRMIVENGRVTRMRGFTINITKQKQTELELAESEARYALAARGSNDGIWDWNLKTGQIHISARFREILGYRSSDKIYTYGWDRFEEIIHPDDLERVSSAIDGHIARESSGVSVDFRLRHADGNWRWVSLRGVASFDHGMATRMAGSLSDISERGSYYDKLTNLPGRSLFNDRLERAIRMGQRDAKYQFAVLFLDLDRFKVVNDSLGHLIGDLLLIEVARRLEACLRPGDTVARLGGDEFVVLLENLQDDQDSQNIAERIRESLAQPFHLNGHDTFSGASIGIVSNATGYNTLDDYLRAADTAMYQAKGHGLGVAIYDEQMHTQATLRLETESSLRKAIETNELVLLYQPIISLETGIVHGFEALVRWMHPRRGLIPPVDFIPIAEEMGLIVALGQWVIFEACQQLMALGQLGQERLYISVNVSGRQLQQPKFAQEVSAMLYHFGIHPERLHLELTENSIVEAADVVLDNIERLRLMGVRIHLDDFGTGYSSLSYLRKLPIDSLKIDRSFISQDSLASSRLIVEAVVRMAKALGLSVVCEGIETRNQASWLKGLECDYGQGFLYSRPLPAASIEGLVQNQIKIQR